MDMITVDIHGVDLIDIHEVGVQGPQIATPIDNTWKRGRSIFKTSIQICNNNG